MTPSSRVSAPGKIFERRSTPKNSAATVLLGNMSKLDTKSNMTPTKRGRVSNDMQGLVVSSVPTPGTDISKFAGISSYN